MTTKTTVFAITGYLNFLGELKQSEGGTLYRNIILGRGENELAYSAVLFGAAAKLAHYELKKGDKVRLTNIELQPDRTTDNFKTKRIANIFTLVATDWEVVEEWSNMNPGTVVDNGAYFHGFANHVNVGKTANDKPSVGLLIGGGNSQMNSTVSINAYGKAVENASTIEKGSVIIPTKMSLMAIKDGDKTIANKFYLALNDFEVRTKGGNQNVAQPQQRQAQAQAPQQQQQQPQPQPDFDSFDDDIPF